MDFLLPIITAVITGCFMSRKYRKEIRLLKATHENEIEKLRVEHVNNVEKLQMEYKHQYELISQQAGANMMEGLIAKAFDEALKNEDVKKQLHQGFSSGLSKNR